MEKDNLFVFGRGGVGDNLFAGVFEFFGTFTHTVQSTDDNKDTKSDNQEVYDVLDEVAVGDYGRGAAAEEIRNRDCEVFKFGTAANERDDWHQNIIDEGSDDCRESTADDNADGEIHNVAFVDKFFEFIEEGAVLFQKFRVEFFTFFYLILLYLVFS